jgi:hypothetical protein
MYPIEYICTREETINTGISIETVNESKWNPHNTFRDSESIHLNTSIDTGVLFNPTSKKATTAKIVVTTTAVQVIKWAPENPILLPKKPETIDPNSGKIIIARYII